MKVLNEWVGMSAGVPQGSILGPLFFLIYINDLPDEIISKIKIFADDSSLFSLIIDHLRCAAELNSDMQKISEWAHQWKMSFNPDPSKQAVEVYFTRRQNPPIAPGLIFNDAPIPVQDHQKHLGLVLDKKLAFDDHLSEKFLKARRGIGLINRLREFLPRDSLVTIYKAHVRPHLDYGDIIYDCPGNANFTEKIEKIQYDACLAITGCFRGTSREKLYLELGLESLTDRRFCRRLTFFTKLLTVWYHHISLIFYLVKHMKKRKLMKGGEKDLHFEFPFLGQNVTVPLFFLFVYQSGTNSIRTYVNFHQ